MTRLEAYREYKRIWRLMLKATRTEEHDRLHVEMLAAEAVYRAIPRAVSPKNRKSRGDVNDAHANDETLGLYEDGRGGWAG